jgi:hypothetical protein
MIMKRAMLAIAVAIALTACQSGGGQVPAKHDPLADALAAAEADVKPDYQPTPAFRTKMKDLIVSMTDRMLSKCMDATSEPEMQACLLERVLVGFDRDDTLRKQCKLWDDIDDDFKCVVYGGLGNDIRSKLVDQTAVPFNWVDPQDSVRAAFRQLVLEQLRACMSHSSASDPFDCYMARITTVLALDDGDLEPCVAYKDDDDLFGSCVGESYTYKYMKAGVARM